jgi:hypothetical protein
MSAPQLLFLEQVLVLCVKRPISWVLMHIVETSAVSWTAISITLLDKTSQASLKPPAFLHGNYRPCKATGRPFLDAADLQPPQTFLNVVAFQPRESESQELAPTESILSYCTCSKDGIHQGSTLRLRRKPRISHDLGWQS